MCRQGGNKKHTGQVVVGRKGRLQSVSCQTVCDVEKDAVRRGVPAM